MEEVEISNPAIDIIREVADEFGVSPEDLRGKAPEGKYRLFNARRKAIRRLREERRLSLNQIGTLMGGRGHQTIKYYLSDEFRATKIKRLHKKGYIVIQGSILSIKAHVECGGCGTPFVVELDPDRTTPKGWTTFDIAVDAIRGGNNNGNWHPDAKRAKEEQFGLTSVQGSHVLCPECTEIVDGSPASREDEVKALLEEERANREAQLHGT